MNQHPEPEGGRSSARGESAWQEARDEVAARNRATRKAAIERRETYEKERHESRRAAEIQRHSELIAKHRTERRPSSP